MIAYVSGDILLTKAMALAHGVAPNDDFKKGLASSLREQWPSLYKDFRHFCKSTHPPEGSLWTWRSAGSPLIVNLFTQAHPVQQGGTPGRAKVTYVNSALRNLKKLIESEKLSSLAITKLATGEGGLPWDEVKPLIESHFKELKIKIYVYETYHRGEAAKEN